MTTQTPSADPGQERERAQTCAECGTPPTPGQSFCEGCGAVLRWTPGDPAPADSAAGPAPAGGPAPAREPEPADAPAGPAPAALAPSWAAADDEADAAAPAAADKNADVDADADTARLPSATDRARALLVPVADPERRAAQTPSVAPVLPGRPIGVRPRAQAPSTEPDPEGGIPCPWCATGNRPERHFCRRCAMAMVGRPHDPQRRAWWRRLGFGNREVPWAGDRPRLRRGLGRILTWVAGAAALALLITATFNVGTAVQAVQDHFAKRAPVAPDSVRASRSFSGHGAALAFDKINNTWWGPGVSQSGDGEWIEARFQQPTRLLDVVITPGISTRASDLSQSALPHLIEARITNSDGHITTRFLTLDQSSGYQRRAFRVGTVSSVRFIIRSAYGAAADKQVSIAEIEFFGRSNANS